MRRPIVVGNWKMYGALSDALVLATAIRNGVENFSNLEAIICPPAIWLPEVAEVISKKNDHISPGAQNIHYLSEGEYTGEISAPMVKDVANYVIVGHSERRKYFSETTEIISRKVAAAVDADLSPIICVGEEKVAADSAEKVSRDLKNLLVDIKKNEYKKIIVAYEPVYAVGAAEPANPEYCAKVIQKLREVVGYESPILYGGSINPGNVFEFVKRPEIDGVLVGRASLKASDFIKICRIVSEYKKII
ncbi:MAG: triose-phosphate isomerase [Candidatus Berkelbacteria bacterium]|nr:triose-phosphate isomerase [Candidatus Berkelbacteria bacterium]